MFHACIHVHHTRAFMCIERGRRAESDSAFVTPPSSARSQRPPAAATDLVSAAVAHAELRLVQANIYMKHTHYIRR